MQPVAIRGLVKSYGGSGDGTVLRSLDLNVGAGEIVALIGPSGCGKTTLLNILAGVETATAGSVLVGDVAVDQLGADALVKYRRDGVGLVRQGGEQNLLMHLSALENVMVPARFAGHGRSHARVRARRLLDLVGMRDRARNRPRQLSGGQQQRVALATALVNEPGLLLADEPTSALDVNSTHDVYRLLRSVRDQLGTTVVIVTHDRSVAEHVDRVVDMREGAIAGQHTDAAGSRLLLVDGSGRVQLPVEWMSAHGHPTRVRAEIDGDAVVFKPEGEHPG
jgi:ABC-type lipoprotein export system ATPase subunit